MYSKTKFNKMLIVIQFKMLFCSQMFLYIHMYIEM